MPKEWKINSMRRDPRSKIIACKFCFSRPTKWYKLMSTTVYRCEKHKTLIDSPVYDQGSVSSKGECIGMEFNPTFEVGSQLQIDYFRKSGSKYNLEALEKETADCKDNKAHSWIEPGDPELLDKLKIIVEHLKKEHPILYSNQTYNDEKGEHTLLLDYPEQYHLLELSKRAVTEHFKYFIPKELVGTNFSAKELREKVDSGQWGVSNER